MQIIVIKSYVQVKEVEFENKTPGAYSVNYAKEE